MKVMCQQETRFQRPLSTAVLLKMFVSEALQSTQRGRYPWKPSLVRLVKILELT